MKKSSGIQRYIILFFFLFELNAIAVYSFNIDHKFTFSEILDLNRTLGISSYFQSTYNITFLNQYSLYSGFSLNQTKLYLNAYFFELGYLNIIDTGSSFLLKFLANQYLEYNMGTNSIIPYLRWNNEIFMAELGINLHFLNLNEKNLWNIFYYNTPVFESFLYYCIGVQFLLFERRYILGIKVCNNDIMFAGNMGNFMFKFNNIFVIDKTWELFLKFRIIPTGNIALSATYYKTVIHGGVKLSF